MKSPITIHRHDPTVPLKPGVVVLGPVELALFALVLILTVLAGVWCSGVSAEPALPGDARLTAERVGVKAYRVEAES